MQRYRNSISKPVRTCPQYSDHVRCLRNAFFCTFECSYSSVSRSILLKLHTLTRLIESFLTTYGLSNCGEDKWEVHTFVWVVAGHCLRAGIIESHNFFVLRRILVKFRIRTRLIGSFSSTYWSWSCAEEKLHFTPGHTVPQLKRDEGLFPPLPISLAYRNGLKKLPRQILVPV